jgi:hypothetical protein
MNEGLSMKLTVPDNPELVFIDELGWSMTQPM